jgi:predicted flap endonuclease-1-like 5' DNA nuclease
MEINKMTIVLILLGLMIAAFVIGWLFSRLLNKVGSSDNDGLLSEIADKEAELEACTKNNTVLASKISAANAAATTSSAILIADSAVNTSVSANISNSLANNLVADVANLAVPVSAAGLSVENTSSAGSNSVDTDRKDDLKIVEGIGPKIEELFHNAGILTFAQLANSSIEKLKEILEAAGPRYQMHDPSTWPQQGNLANNGQWTALKILQDDLKAGKVN